MPGAKTSIWDKRKRMAFRNEKRNNRPKINLFLRNVFPNVKLTPTNPIRAM
jgi:hypothetical protein